MRIPKRKQQIILWSTRILSVLMLLLVTGAVILYQKGYYDFTFIERPDKESAPTDANTTDAVTEGTQLPIPPKDTEDVTADTDAPILTPPPANEPHTAAEVLVALPTTADAEADGYEAQSGGAYDASWILARMELSYERTEYAYSYYQARRLRVTEYNRNCIVTTESTRRTRRPAVMAKNGYLIVDNGDKTLSLYDENGTLLLKNYEEETYALTDYSTPDGQALFRETTYVTQKIHKPIIKPDGYTGRPVPSGEYEEEESEVEVEVYTYYTLASDGTFVKADDKAVDAALRVGVVFDAPTDYGESDCDIEVYESDYGGRFGYRSKSTGKTIVYATYRWAHEFREGYGICSDGQELFVINEKGETVYSVGCHEPDIFFTRNEITYPDTNGIEALGCYYFDHGLTRVRKRPNLVTYTTYYYIKTDDFTTLIDANGNEFEIPGGYTLEGYSDGMLLLKKKGEELYGYMNYRGEWIVDPVYSYARPFLMGLGVVGDANGKKGIVNTDGIFVVPQAFDEISDISKGTVAIYDKETGWSVCRFMGK